MKARRVMAAIALIPLLFSFVASAQLKGLALGLHHSCAIFESQRAKCWGNNNQGSLGMGDIMSRGDEPNEMGDFLGFVKVGKAVKAVASGNDFSCAILEGGVVKCWGLNHVGQLATGDTLNKGDEPSEVDGLLPVAQLGKGFEAVQISAQNNHTCALSKKGQVKCWGRNDSGQLGLGNTIDYGITPETVGSYLPFVPTSPYYRPVKVVAGGFHSCALFENGRVKCWGRNDFGQLGQEHARNIGDELYEMGGNLNFVPLDPARKVKSIGLGSSHTCVLLVDGEVKCWGKNYEGQLGLGDTKHRGDSAGSIKSLPSVDLGHDQKAKQLSCGNEHCCVLLESGQVKCWGQNEFSQLGAGHLNFMGDEPGEMGENLLPTDLGLPAFWIEAGNFHNCAFLINHGLKCWGDNISGQLGVGDTFPRGDRKEMMGNILEFIHLGINSRGFSPTPSFFP